MPPCRGGYEPGVAKVPWTYDVPPAGADSAGLEGYVVEAASGERVGLVVAVLGRDDEVYVAVERGSPPLTRDLRAVRWDDVASIDNTSLAVRLKLRADALEQALELDPDKGIEGGGGDAVRLTELPTEIAGFESPEAGPVDRPSYLLALGLAVAGLFSLLALFVAAQAVEFTWHFALFAIPAVLLALAGLTAYRLFRRPYARR